MDVLDFHKISDFPVGENSREHMPKKSSGFRKLHLNMINKHTFNTLKLSYDYAWKNSRKSTIKSRGFAM